MAIPMGIPPEFLRAVLDGRVVRYGCILKDAASGQIVGHLKELAGLSQLLCGAPVHPWLAGAAAAAQVGQWLDTHRQLAHVRELLGQLRLVGSVAALASVTGLGVSVAGFAVVLRRLARLEQNLNEGMGRLRAELERLHLKADLLRMAELTSAWQQLDGACRTGLPGRAGELLRGADRCFQKYRNYYHALVVELRPLGRPQLTLPQVLELYGRYFACAAAELEANFLLHDFAQWRYRHEVIAKQLDDAYALGPREMLRCRVDALGLVCQSELQELTEQVVAAHDSCRENRERLLTAGQEVDWLDRHKVTPEEYLRSLREAPETEGVVLLPQTG